MPDRTLEELEQIEKEVELIKEIWDRHEGEYIWHNPFDRKTRKDDLKELYQPIINDFKNLLNSGKIQSCEGINFIRSEIKGFKNVTEYIISPARTIINQSEKYRPVRNMTLDEIYDELRLNPLGKKINQELDQIETSPCTPIACSQQVLEEAKTLAYNPEQITITDSQTDKPKSKSLII